MTASVSRKGVLVFIVEFSVNHARTVGDKVVFRETFRVVGTGRIRVEARGAGSMGRDYLARSQRPFVVILMRTADPFGDLLNARNDGVVRVIPSRNDGSPTCPALWVTPTSVRVNVKNHAEPQPI
jgi:hypothetical protein